MTNRQSDEQTIKIKSYQKERRKIREIGFRIIEIISQKNTTIPVKVTDLPKNKRNVS